LSCLSGSIMPVAFVSGPAFSRAFFISGLRN
jgi:hypothetical protein